jgi:hypothetical protein
MRRSRRRSARIRSCASYRRDGAPLSQFSSGRLAATISEGAPRAQERLALTADGRVLVTLKAEWHDGTTHLLFDYYDLSIGGRIDLWRDTIIGFVNAIVPLNRDGFRSDVIPLAGIEAAF